MEEKARHELLKSIYEQHWLHARHLENERLWFTNIYVLITGGLLAYTFNSNGAHFWPWPILLIVFILSLAGLFMSHSLGIPFYYHSRMADIIQIKEWHLPYHYFYRKTGGKSGFDPSKFIRFSEVFYLLYSAMSSFSMGFLFYELAHGLSWYWYWEAIVLGLILFGVIYGCLCKFAFKKIEKEAHGELEKLRASVSGENGNP